MRASAIRSIRSCSVASRGSAFVLLEALETRTHLSTYTPSATDRLINLDDFRADPRFSEIDGRGYAAVIIDDGLDRDHPFFGPDANHNGIADRIVYSYDFADNDSNAEATSSHGSNVTSIVGSSGEVHRGMAPGVNLIHLKVFGNKAAFARDSDIERALKWVVSNVTRYNIVSVNMSLGHGNYRSAPPAGSSLYSDELATLASRNVIVSAAAGNSFGDLGSKQGLSYPAADPSVLAVGAVFERAFGRYRGGKGSSAKQTGPDRITPFSQRSTTQWMIFAPGSPIKGAGHKGNVVSINGTSQASPHVAGIVVLMQQLADRILGRRLGLGELRVMMKQSGKKIVDGDDERDDVRNTGATFRRIDVMGLAEAIWAKAGAEVALSLGTTKIIDGTSTISFGSTPQATSLEKTFTIGNQGVKPLIVSNLQTPGGFSIVSGPSHGTIAPGGTATFVLRLDGAVSGSYRGEVRLQTNDPDERVFTFMVTGTVSSTATILDDGTSSVVLTGAWSTETGGYSNDRRVADLGAEEPSFADWTFTKLIPGRYRVSATWTPASDLTTTATYFITDGAGVTEEAIVNQRIAPADRTVSGTSWEDLAVIDVTASELLVSLDGLGFDEGPVTGRMVADAIRIERLGPIDGDANIFVTLATIAVVDDGDATSLGTTSSGRPTLKALTIRNFGGEDLLIDGFIEIPAGFSIVGTPASILKPGTSTTIQLRVDAGAPGMIGGTLTLATSDPDQSEFHINVSATVTPVSRVIDNGETGFVATGAWTNSTFGFRNDGLSAAGDSGATAQWTFARLTPGVYRVSASWSGSGAINPSLASNTPVRISSPSGSSADVTIDQRYGPDSELITNVWWRHLTEFRVVADPNATTGTLIVLLGGFADARTVADAIRIERVDN